MEIIEDSLPVELDAFLDRPLFCFLAQSPAAGPRVSPLWFLWEDESLWIIARLPGRSYPDRVREDPRAAVGVVDFDPAEGGVYHVGIRGQASLEPFDRDRADRLLEPYLGADQSEWDPMFRDLDPEEYRLLRVEPETVVARDQSYQSSGH
jgi:hypothetical protein